MNQPPNGDQKINKSPASGRYWERGCTTLPTDLPNPYMLFCERFWTLEIGGQLHSPSLLYQSVHPSVVFREDGKQCFEATQRIALRCQFIYQPPSCYGYCHFSATRNKAKRRWLEDISFTDVKIDKPNPNLVIRSIRT
jgi:hypothetical protein